MSALLKGAVVLTVGIAVFLLYSVLFYDATLPTCDSPAAEAEVARAMEDAPMGRVNGLKLIKITNATEVSASETERRCRGTAHLNNARTYPIRYKFYIDGEGDYMVEASVRGL